jgi:hypothetical protein
VAGALTVCVPRSSAVPKVTVPGSAGVGTGVSLGTAGIEPAADEDGAKEIEVRALGDGVWKPTVGVDLPMFESRKPTTITSSTAPMAAPMLIRDA